MTAPILAFPYMSMAPPLLEISTEPGTTIGIGV